MSSPTLPVAAVLLSMGPVLHAGSDRRPWTQVLYQAFQTGALSAQIILHDRPIRVPMGWISLSDSGEAEHLWTMARWDGGKDRRTVERTYLVTNGNGLPGCWLTKFLSYEVGPEFELQCVMLNHGTAAALSMRVVDDEGKGYEAIVSMGVESQKNQIRRIIEPRAVRIVDGERVIDAERTKVIAGGVTSLPVLTRLQWYRPKLAYRGGHLVLSVDGQVLVRVKVPGRRYTTVQFMSPQRIYLDDLEMWGAVDK